MRYVHVKYIRPTLKGCVVGLAKPDSIPGPVTAVPGSINQPTHIYRVLGVPEHVRDEEVLMLCSVTLIATFRRHKIRFEELGEGKLIVDQA